jgi:hypothetical protein
LLYSVVIADSRQQDAYPAKRAKRIAAAVVRVTCTRESLRGGARARADM